MDKFEIINKVLFNKKKLSFTTLSEKINNNPNVASLIEKIEQASNGDIVEITLGESVVYKEISNSVI